MEKFNKAKVGDRVFSTLYGWGKIIEISPLFCTYPIKVDFGGEAHIRFAVDGKFATCDKYPTLFWNEVKLPSDEEDKKPFDLVEFLRENTEPENYIKGKENYFIFYDTENTKFYIYYHTTHKYVGLVYLKSSNIRYVVDTLNENKITPEQLKEAYKELGWL